MRSAISIIAAATIALGCNGDDDPGPGTSNNGVNAIQNNVSPNNSNVEPGPLLRQPEGLALDLANNRIFVSEAALEAVYVVDATTGARRVLVGEGVGEGPRFGDRAFSHPADIVMSDDGSLLVADKDWGAIVRVDPETGVFSHVTASSGPVDPVGGGVTTFPPSEIVLDSANDRVLAASDVNGGASLVAVDLTTGERTYVSSAEEDEVGIGPLRTARGIVLDPSDPFAYVVDPSLAGIVKVDLRDGDRTTLTGCDSPSPYGTDCADGTIVGEGPEMRGHHAAYHAASNSILVADRDLMAIFAVDLDTGDRTIISQEAERGEGAGFAIPTEVVVDPESGRIFVGDNHGGQIVEVDQSTGDRTLVSGADRPPGGR